MEYLGTRCQKFCFTECLIYSFCQVWRFPLNFVRILDVFYSIKIRKILLSQQLYGPNYLSTTGEMNTASWSLFLLQIWNYKELPEIFYRILQMQYRWTSVTKKERYHCRDLSRLIHFPYHGSKMIIRTKCDHTCWGFTVQWNQNINPNVFNSSRSI